MQACFLPADILLPDAAADFEKWAVVACDQFTSQPEYWRKAAEIVGDAPSTLNLVYPPEMLVIPSPVAIFKNSPNVDAAKKFVDFILSKEGQQIIVEDGTLPVRADVKVPDRYKQLPSVEDAMKRAMKIDYQAIMAEKEATIKKFTDIMQK